jgi:hypothetical protein
MNRETQYWAGMMILLIFILGAMVLVARDDIESANNSETTPGVLELETSMIYVGSGQDFHFVLTSQLEALRTQ